MDQQDIRDQIARSAWNPCHSNEEIDDPQAGLLGDLDGGVPVVGGFSHNHGNHFEALPSTETCGDLDKACSGKANIYTAVSLWRGILEEKRWARPLD